MSKTLVWNLEKSCSSSEWFVNFEAFIFLNSYRCIARRQPSWFCSTKCISATNLLSQSYLLKSRNSTSPFSGCLKYPLNKFFSPFFCYFYIRTAQILKKGTLRATSRITTRLQRAPHHHCRQHHRHHHLFPGSLHQHKYHQHQRQRLMWKPPHALFPRPLYPRKFPRQ